MEVIQSFTIDHTHLKPGIYVSREDKGFTTYDLRITEPNKEPAVAPAAIHSIEHLMATWFRNSRVKDDVVYVGPMGCLTGMYIIMLGTYSVEDMRQLTIECLEWILTQDEVPATRPEACGNYLLHDLPMCKWECARYLDRLKNDFHSEYKSPSPTANSSPTHKIVIAWPFCSAKVSNKIAYRNRVFASKPSIGRKYAIFDAFR